MDDNIVSTPKFVAFVIALSILVALLIVNDYGFISIIDDANVAFHEAGHFIFEVFGDTMGLWGGTLGQLLPPIISIVVFWRRKSLVSVSVALLWLFENFFDIAAYMETAKSDGPIVFGVLGWGYHDWWCIFSHWGILHYDTTIAAIMRITGWLGLFSTLVGTTYLWWQCQKIFGRPLAYQHTATKIGKASALAMGNTLGQGNNAVVPKEVKDGIGDIFTNLDM